MKKFLKVEANRASKRYALVLEEIGYGVWAECLNYSRHVPGGIQASWRYCERGLSQEMAEKLFQKKIGGKQR